MKPPATQAEGLLVLPVGATVVPDWRRLAARKPGRPAPVGNPRRAVVAKRDKDLFETLRARGVRKRAADGVAKSFNGSAKQKAARRAVSDLSTVVAEIQDRIQGGPEKRRAAAKKAARTRKRKAQRRSDAAKRAARTRA